MLAHLPLPAGRVDQLLLTRHYRRDYLYAECSSAKTATQLDVTDAGHPAILSGLSLLGSGFDSGVLLTVAGNAALVAGGSDPAQPATADRTIRVLSFADPQHPVVQREFHNVSSMTHDDGRGLIFLANSDGLWILQQRLAQDPAQEAQWEHDVLRNH